jgi:hypothetical protein
MGAAERRKHEEHMTTRTGLIFSILIDFYMERAKGGKQEKRCVIVYRYDDMDPINKNWHSYWLPYKNITPSSWRRLIQLAPLASSNRKAYVS